LERLLNYLDTQSLDGIHLMAVAGRFPNKEAWSTIVTSLERRAVFHPQIWLWGLIHMDYRRASLGLQEMNLDVGPYFDFPLVQFDVFKRKC
jgi:hypothetical protein